MKKLILMAILGLFTFTSSANNASNEKPFPVELETLQDLLNDQVFLALINNSQLEEEGWWCDNLGWFCDDCTNPDADHGSVWVGESGTTYICYDGTWYGEVE